MTVTDKHVEAALAKLRRGLSYDPGNYRGAADKRHIRCLEPDEARAVIAEVQRNQAGWIEASRLAVHHQKRADAAEAQLAALQRDHAAVVAQRDACTCDAPKHRGNCPLGRKEVSAWYMRDNHTFARLSLTTEDDIVGQVSAIFHGYCGSYGSLFARYQPADVGIEDATLHTRDKFDAVAVRAWAARIIAIKAALAQPDAARPAGEESHGP